MDVVIGCLFWIAGPATGIPGLFILLRVAAAARPSGRYCSQCGYDMTGLEDGARCPECGVPNIHPNESFCRRCNHDLSGLDENASCPQCGNTTRGPQLPRPDQAMILAAGVPSVIAYLVVLITTLTVAGGPFWLDVFCIAPPFAAGAGVLIAIGRGLLWQQILAVSICMNLFGAAVGVFEIADSYSGPPGTLNWMEIIFMTVVVGVGMGFGTLIGATSILIQANAAPRQS